jgi:hypothetical protein
MRERGKRFVCCGSFLCCAFLFFGRFSKIYSMSKDMELESCFGHILYCWSLFNGYTHISGWITIFWETMMWVSLMCYWDWQLLFIHGFCMITHSLHPNKWMSFIHGWIMFIYTIRSFLYSVLCKMSVLELMKVIQKKDNFQCMVLLYFDLLLGAHSQ